MIELRKTKVFAEWLDGLRDIQARARVQARIERLVAGNPGDVEPGGDKATQSRDIKAALGLARNLSE